MGSCAPFLSKDQAGHLLVPCGFFKYWELRPGAEATPEKTLKPQIRE